MSDCLRGIIVPEEEVARDLGFVNVWELRMSQTEQGRRILDLTEELMHCCNDRNQFRWAGMRMVKVLNKLKEHVTDPKALLAIGVVLDEAVDWNREVTEWTGI